MTSLGTVISRTCWRFIVVAMNQVAEGRKEVQRAAGLSVLAAAFLTILKLVIGYVTNSLGIFSEGIHSGLDFAAAGITLIAVRRASKAPDEDHMYGHGKIENFAAFAETIILWITAVWIILEALHRIEVQDWPEASIWGIIVMVIGIIVTFTQSRTLYRAAEKHGSQALEADALHFRTDMISSVVVLLGLGFVWIGIPIADSLAAIGVAIIIFIVSARLGKRTFDALTDRAPEGLQEDIIQRVSEVSGVVECIRVRARHSGPELFADIVVTVDENIATAEAHNIAESIEQKLVELAPRVDVVVHIEPAEGDISQFADLGVGCVFGIVVFLVYRVDRKETEKRIHQNSKRTEDRLAGIIEAERSSRELQIQSNDRLIQRIGDVLDYLKNGHKGN